MPTCHYLDLEANVRERKKKREKQALTHKEPVWIKLHNKSQDWRIVKGDIFLFTNEKVFTLSQAISDTQEYKPSYVAFLLTQFLPYWQPLTPQVNSIFSLATFTHLLCSGGVWIPCLVARFLFKHAPFPFSSPGGVTVSCISPSR